MAQITDIVPFAGRNFTPSATLRSKLSARRFLNSRQGQDVVGIGSATQLDRLAERQPPRHRRRPRVIARGPTQSAISYHSGSRRRLLASSAALCLLGLRAKIFAEWK